MRIKRESIYHKIPSRESGKFIKCLLSEVLNEALKSVFRQTLEDR